MARLAVRPAHLAAAALLGTAALLGACAAGEADRALVAGPVEFERAAPSGEPNLARTRDGRAALTWIESDENGEGSALRIAIRQGDAWSAPRTVRSSDRLFVNWADFPSAVEMEDGTLAVHWLEKVADAPYAYHVMMSLSGDGGIEWTEPARVHDDTTPTEHGFVSMVPWNGGAAVAWLDGRAMAEPSVPKGAVGGAAAGSEDGGDDESGPAAGAMSVRFRTVAPDGELGPEVVLDDRTCECCQTAMVRSGDELVAAYRDRSASEVRDISVVRGAGERWSRPASLSDDGWTIPGCPVNGPQLSAAGESVAAAWYTGAGGEPQVYAAFSTDGGASFDSRIRVDEGLPLGRVDIEWLGDGSAAVFWLEASGETPRVLARRVFPDGLAGEPVLISETSSERSSGFPRAVRIAGEVLVAWTRDGDDGGVRVRSLRLPDHSADRGQEMSGG